MHLNTSKLDTLKLMPFTSNNSKKNTHFNSTVPIICPKRHVWLSTGCPERLWSLHPQRQSNPPGHGPGHPALDGTSWARGLDQIASRGTFQPQPYCDSIINSHNSTWPYIFVTSFWWLEYKIQTLRNIFSSSTIYLMYFQLCSMYNKICARTLKVFCFLIVFSYQTG